MKMEEKAHLRGALQPWNWDHVEANGSQASGKWWITHLHICDLVLIDFALPVQLVL